MRDCIARVIGLAVAALAIALGSTGASGQCRPAYAPTRAAASEETPATLRSSADAPVWRTLIIGTFRSGMAIRDELDRNHCAIGDSADEMLGRPAFTVSAGPRTVDLVLLSPRQLGFAGESAVLAVVYAQALKLGFLLCAPEVGPLLRLTYREQPLGEFLSVAMQPIATFAGEPSSFTLANGGAGLSLIAGHWDGNATVPTATRLVFTRPPASMIAVAR